MRRLANKVAVITGGNSGIGLATANLFHAQGAQVIVTARSTASYEKAKKDLPHLDVIKCDVSDLRQLDAMYARIKSNYQALDVVFANAGIAVHKPTVEVSESDFDAVFGTNIKGVYFTVQKALPLLRDGSSVVLNASCVAEQGVPGASLYCATKAAVRNLVRTWTMEIPASKARFNVVSPGYTTTPIFSRIGLNSDQMNAFIDATVEKIPAKRFATAEEIANVALFLASSDSSYVMGSNFIVDGGIAQV